MPALRPPFLRFVLLAALLLAALDAPAQTADSLSAPPSVVVRARPAPDTSPARAPRVDPWWGYDKAQHFTASVLITLAAQYAFEAKAGASRRTALPASAGIAAGAGLAKEVWDVRRPGGTGFSRRDLVWDALGVGAAVVFVLL